MNEQDIERVRDYLIREGWSEFTIRETLSVIEEEDPDDPEGGGFLLRCHLEQARKWAH